MEFEPIFWDIETTGLNPMHERWQARSFYHVDYPSAVTAIGYGYMGGWEDAETLDDCEGWKVDVVCANNEYETLQEGTSELETIVDDNSRIHSRRSFMVGYNSREFDHPYAGARYARKRLENEKLNHGLKRLDMKRVARSDDDVDDRYPSQDEWAEALGIPVEDETDGSDMPKMWDEGRYDDIMYHCKEDIKVLMEIFLQKKEEAYAEVYDHYSDISGDPPKFIDDAEF